jgi:arsenate reductase
VGTDAEKAFAFRTAFNELETRIKLFVNVPVASLDASTLQSRLRDIGNSGGAVASA